MGLQKLWGSCQEPCWKALLSQFTALHALCLLHELMLEVHPVLGLVATLYVKAEDFS